MPCRTVLLVFAGLLLSVGPLSAQALPDSVLTPSLPRACRGDGSRLSLYLLNWAAESQPLRGGDRFGLPPVARSAYALAEAHHRPYVDPQVSSTWAQTYAASLLQPTLRVVVVPDSSFDRWERGGYALDLDWNDPPVVQREVRVPYRPNLQVDSLTVLYAFPDRRRALLSYLLPLGARSHDVIRRRLDCIARALGLTDEARTSDDLHSPPRLSLTMSTKRTHAIAAYGWGTRGGVWVLYRRDRPGQAWTEVRPIGSWTYRPADGEPSN